MDEGDSVEAVGTIIKTKITKPSEKYKTLTTSIGTTKIELKWEEPEDNGGTIIRGYKIEINGSVINETGTEIIIIGLEKGIEYQFTIRARNSEGLGKAKETLIKIRITEPGKVEKISFNSIATNGTLKWEKPQDNGGTIIRTYRVKYKNKTDNEIEKEYEKWLRKYYDFEGIANNQIIERYKGVVEGTIEGTIEKEQIVNNKIKYNNLNVLKIGTSKGVKININEKIGTIKTISLWVRMEGELEGKKNLFKAEKILNGTQGLQIRQNEKEWEVIVGEGTLKGTIEWNQWTNIIIVQGINKIAFYQEGIFKGSLIASIGMNKEIGIIEIGNGVIGQIDEIKIYNKELDQEEINLIKEGFLLNQATLVYLKELEINKTYEFKVSAINDIGEGVNRNKRRKYKGERTKSSAGIYFNKKNKYNNKSSVGSTIKSGRSFNR